MKPVNFKYQNIVFAKDQPEYQPLPALKIDSPTGEVISCWKLSFKERIQVLVFGKVWMSLMSFNKPLTPSYLAVNRKEVFTHSDDFIKWHKKIFLSINKLWKTKKNRRFLLAVLTGVLMYAFAFVSSSLWAYLIPWRLLEIIVWFIAYFGLLAIVLYNWDSWFEKYCS